MLDHVYLLYFMKTQQENPDVENNILLVRLQYPILQYFFISE